MYLPDDTAVKVKVDDGGKTTYCLKASDPACWLLSGWPGLRELGVCLQIARTGPASMVVYLCCREGISIQPAWPHIHAGGSPVYMLYNAGVRTDVIHILGCVLVSDDHKGRYKVTSCVSGPYECVKEYPEGSRIPLFNIGV